MELSRQRLSGTEEKGPCEKIAGLGMSVIKRMVGCPIFLQISREECTRKTGGLRMGEEVTSLSPDCLFMYL